MAPGTIVYMRCRVSIDARDPFQAARLPKELQGTELYLESIDRDGNRNGTGLYIAKAAHVLTAEEVRQCCT